MLLRFLYFSLKFCFFTTLWLGFVLLFPLCTHVTSSFEDLELTLIPEHFWQLFLQLLPLHKSLFLSEYSVNTHWTFLFYPPFLLTVLLHFTFVVALCYIPSVFRCSFILPGLLNKLYYILCLCVFISVARFFFFNFKILWASNPLVSNNTVLSFHYVF